VAHNFASITKLSTDIYWHTLHSTLIL